MPSLYLAIGHKHGRDPGAVDPSTGEKENDIARQIGSACEQALKGSDVKVYSEVPTSQDLLYRDSVTKANRLGVDLFLSIHLDWYKGYRKMTPLVWGSEASRRIAQAIIDSCDARGVPANGLKIRRDLHVLRATTMPACLVEAGRVGDSLNDAVNAWGDALAEAVLRYFGLPSVLDKKITPPAPTKPSKDVTRLLPVLRQGSKGLPVKRLQHLLLANGRPLRRWGADGHFGNETKIAVLEFQKRSGIADDGVVGPVTWGKLLGV